MNHRPLVLEIDRSADLATSAFLCVDLAKTCPLFETLLFTGNCLEYGIESVGNDLAIISASTVPDCRVRIIFNNPDQFNLSIEMKLELKYQQTLKLSQNFTKCEALEI